MSERESNKRQRERERMSEREKTLIVLDGYDFKS